eukprot:TRINITY_DN124139_c0_g1_i1.p1 TRINITY_DN124139_c0_g1~~TRINITY_DN124139_c0_g1_i1.p1  ORF type:complete len:264 (+),score=39.48 TRINITY_DN124139_c0_g1_i1:78-869(+)
MVLDAAIVVIGVASTGLVFALQARRASRRWSVCKPCGKLWVGVGTFLALVALACVISIVSLRHTLAAADDCFTNFSRSLRQRCVPSARQRADKAAVQRRAYRIDLHMVGKGGDSGWETAAISEYTQRLGGAAQPINVETVWHKTDKQLEKAVGKADGALVLDERGSLLTSEEFASALFSRLDTLGSRLTVAIGAADGLPKSLRKAKPLRLGADSEEELSSPALLSLGKMTLPHRFARLVLVEQIYRASEIRRGSKYHRGDPYA